MFKAKWLVAIPATSLCMVATLSGCGDSVDYTPSPPVSESAVVRAYESAVMCDALPPGTIGINKRLDPVYEPCVKLNDFVERVENNGLDDLGDSARKDYQHIRSVHLERFGY